MYGKPYRGFESLSLRQFSEWSSFHFYLRCARYSVSGFRLRALPFAALRVTPAKRLNLKTDVRETVPGVRIPLPPPRSLNTR